MYKIHLIFSKGKFLPPELLIFSIQLIDKNYDFFSCPIDEARKSVYVREAGGNWTELLPPLGLDPTGLVQPARSDRPITRKTNFAKPFDSRCCQPF